MKKIVTLFLTLALLFGTIAFATNENSAYTWCKELPKGATFMFNYSLMSPVRTNQKPSKRFEVNYYLANAFVAGFQKNELSTYALKYDTANVVPVSSVDGVYVYPIASSANTMVGLVWVVVEDGVATISMRLREQVKSYHNDKFVLRVYSSVDELVFSGMTYEFDEPFVVEENVFYFEINGVVSYPAIIGSKKIKNCSAYYKLAEYYRYDNVWKNYRNMLMTLIE